MQTPFGTLSGGQAVTAFTLVNAQGVEMRAIDYGCAIVTLRVPDRHGALDDVVLGCDTLEGYVANREHLGAVCGRYANRIAQGRFTLEGKTYQLARNNGAHHLHGGPHGFDRVVWKAEPFRSAAGAGLVFTYVSPDGDEGYPGRLDLKVTYTLTDRGELVIDYHATTDQPTIVNLTQHSYFNLAGPRHPDVLDHEFQIHAAGYTPVRDMIPTGELAPVAGTPFDFRQPARLGARIGLAHEQLQSCRGFDHNFVLETAGGAPVHAARVVDPASGRVLDVYTTEPGMQFYTGNFLDGSTVGKGGIAYAARAGFCLETQHFPDTPNQPHFPSAVLRPGEQYRTQTTYAFRTL